MFELKPISKAAIPAALAKAERYRLLNEPLEAESICEDVLRADPDNRDALVTMLLAITDQFGRDGHFHVQDARDLLPRLEGQYERAYYSGVILERWGKSLLERGVPDDAASDWLRRAMDQFELAESLSPPGNDDAVLRWNACARSLLHHGQVQPVPAVDEAEPGFDDEVPLH